MWSSIIKYQTSTQIYPIPSNPCFVFPNYGIHGSVCLVEKKYINWARAAQKHFQNFNAETLLNPMQWPWNWLKLTQVFLGFRMGFFLGAGEPRAQIWLRIEKTIYAFSLEVLWIGWKLTQVFWDQGWFLHLEVGAATAQIWFGTESTKSTSFRSDTAKLPLIRDLPIYLYESNIISSS